MTQIENAVQSPSPRSSLKARVAFIGSGSHLLTQAILKSQERVVIQRPEMEIPEMIPFLGFGAGLPDMMYSRFNIEDSGPGLMRQSRRTKGRRSCSLRARSNRRKAR